MSIATDLLGIVNEVHERIELPPVISLHLPPETPDPGVEAEFGLVVLADGSTGFFFALLGDTLRRLHEDVDCSVQGSMRGHCALRLCAGLESADAVDRAVALGTLSAVSQHVFRRAGASLPDASSSLGGLDFSTGDRVGMVGLFPSLARRLRALDVPLTVIELRPDKVQRERNFEVTLDPEALRGCNKVLCTASTLLNGTLEGILGQCAGAQRIALIGPTASCFPDPLFARGIHVVGGSTVVDSPTLLERFERGDKWGEAVKRYALDCDGYPGVQELLERAANRRRVAP